MSSSTKPQLEEKQGLEPELVLRDRLQRRKSMAASLTKGDLLRAGRGKNTPPMLTFWKAHSDAICSMKHIKVGPMLVALRVTVSTLNEYLAEATGTSYGGIRLVRLNMDHRWVAAWSSKCV